MSPASKGNQVNIPELGVTVDNKTATSRAAGDVICGTRKSSLFFLMGTGTVETIQLAKQCLVHGKRVWYLYRIGYHR